MNNSHCLGVVCASAFLILILGLTTTGTVQATLITERFDTDPGWTSFNLPINRNDFGFRNSDFAGGDTGEVGGLFSQTDEVAWYGDDDVGLLGDNDVIQASGLMNIRAFRPDTTTISMWGISIATDSRSKGLTGLAFRSSRTTASVPSRSGSSI